MKTTKQLSKLCILLLVALTVIGMLTFLVAADTTTFTMIAGNVELEAVYAEIVYLDEIAFTVTPPAVGDLAVLTLTPADPTKYGSVTDYLYLYEEPYPYLAPTDAFAFGSKYARQEYYDLIPITIEVTGGKLYVNGTEIASGTKIAPNTVVTIVAEPPADHIFDKWVTVNGTVTFADANAATTTFTMPAGAVSVKATYKEVEKILLTEVNVTLDVPVVGEKPDFTAIIPDSANYSVSITWETSANGWTEMTANSVFENGFFYDVYIKVIPSEGYKVDSTTVVKLNGAEAYGSGNSRYRSYGDWITSDPTNHWKVCECGKKDAEGAHTYTDASDMTCNTCGHDRTAPHTHGNGQKASCSTCNTAYGALAEHQHGAEWLKDADKHWHECTCGDKKDDADHIPGAAATETQPQTCTVCGYEIAPATGHVTHVPDNEWASNETHHWHTCTGCDEQLDKAAHADDDQNGKCDACDHTMSSSSDEPVDPNGQGEGLSGGAIAAIVVGSVAVAGAGGFALFWFVIRKKSLADLGALLKVGGKKVSEIAKRIGERISSVFKKR